MARVSPATTGFGGQGPDDKRIEKFRDLISSFDLNLFKALANAPLAYRGFCELSLHVFAAGLDRRTRELVVLRVTSLVGSDYEWGGHVVAARIAGLRDDEIRAIREGDLSLLAPAEAAAVRYAEAVETRRVDDEAWDAARAHFDEQAMVELTVLAGFYGLASRTAMALGVELEVDWQGLSHP